MRSGFPRITRRTPHIPHHTQPLNPPTAPASPGQDAGSAVLELLATSGPLNSQIDCKFGPAPNSLAPISIAAPNRGVIVVFAKGGCGGWGGNGGKGGDGGDGGRGGDGGECRQRTVTRIARHTSRTEARHTSRTQAARRHGYAWAQRRAWPERRCVLLATLTRHFSSSNMFIVQNNHTSA